jgi:ketosteroid isomerase-like protein
MTGDEKKGMAQRLLHSAGQGDIAAVELLISDDFVLEQMVRQPDGDYTAAGIRYDRATYLRLLGAVRDLTRDGMHLASDLALAEGDHVALFGTSDAVSRDGRIYRNAYCWHIRFRGDRICLMREFYDTALGNWLLEGG